METIYVAFGSFFVGVLVVSIFAIFYEEKHKKELKDSLGTWRDCAKSRLEIINGNAEQMVKVTDENRRYFETLEFIRDYMGDRITKPLSLQQEINKCEYCDPPKLCNSHYINSISTLNYLTMLKHAELICTLQQAASEALNREAE